MKKLTTDGWVKKAREVHGDKYDYSLVEYVDSYTKVKILCPMHGLFEQLPSSHVSRRSGCPKCGVELVVGQRRLTTEEFVTRVRRVHGNRYDYSLVKYENSYRPVKIICPEHGVFEQAPTTHLSGSGCPQCGAERIKVNIRKHHAAAFSSAKEAFIQKVRKVHENRIDLGDFEYKGSLIAGIAKCTECGNVWRPTPSTLLSGSGCPQCAKTGFLAYKKGYLYVMVDNSEIPTMMKIGCSIDPHNRCKHIIKRAKREGVDISTLCVAKVWKSDTQNIYRVEQELHKRFSDRCYFGKNKVFDGSTEFFYYDGSVFDIIDELFL